LDPQRTTSKPPEALPQNLLKVTIKINVGVILDN
jgi:hypothetical protein